MGKRNNKNHDRKKINLVFDESKRKEYLGGFRKRKLERKKKAQEELQKRLKEEKKRIRQENKESYKKLVVSSRPIPDLEQILQEEEYEDEDDNVNVKIVELSADTLQSNNLCIGTNKPQDEPAPKLNKKSKPKKEIISGMQSDYENESEESEEEENNEQETHAKTKKELKQLLKRQATKKIQKSKVFQMKSRLDRIKNIKKSQSKKRTMKNNIEKSQKLKKGLGRKGKEGKSKHKKSK